jgi:hypothetical protein
MPYLRRRRSVIAAQTKAPAPMTVMTRATVPKRIQEDFNGFGHVRLKRVFFVNGYAVLNTWGGRRGRKRNRDIHRPHTDGAFFRGACQYVSSARIVARADLMDR